MLFKQIKNSLLHLAFPHVCECCGTDVIDNDHLLCLQCLTGLPQTNYHAHANNPIEKLFWGRLLLTSATAQYYFTKESMMQLLMHKFKYRGNQELGFYLGKLIGDMLLASNRFSNIDALVPLPLFAVRERKRGFNQAGVLCEGIASVLNKPVLKNVVSRVAHTKTQTNKSRIDRWLNMEGRFELTNSKAIEDKHVLLVDDVITTGATIEACGNELLKAENVQLSIAALCFSFH